MHFFRNLYDRIRDPDKSFEYHIIIFLTTVSCVALLIAMVFDIVFGENIVEIVTLGALLVLVPISTGLGVRCDRILLGGKLQVVALVFIIMPVTFFFGGGSQGGGVFWLAVTYMYIGMILSGRWRIFMATILSIIAVAEYLIGFFCPEYVYGHTSDMFYKDSLVSLILAGLVVYSMVCYQKMLFREENRRAKEETKRAEELNRAQNQFFSSMSHEIRTPINSILGLNEIILRQEDASDEIRRDAANIQGSGKMLLALVNDILDVSKIEAGKMDIVPVNYSLGSMISEIVNMVWLRAEEKGLKLKVDIDPSLPAELYGDEVRIKQILINLLNNAVKYTKEGTISFHMECEKRDDEKVRIIYSIADTGMGIKQDALPYLFDSFKRVDQKKNRHIEGTGLGLSIVKQLVERMGGEISVNSVYTQGSTFTVTLCQGITNTNELGAIDISSSGGLKKSRKYESGFTAEDAQILIVDDNEMNLEVEKKLLLDTKMQIDTVRSGSEALDHTLVYRYDVILMDHLMPEMDGIECLGKIRKQKGGLNNQIPVIVLTANAGSENVELYRQSGFDGYLLKPVSGSQLEEMLLRYLPDGKISRKAEFDVSRQEMNTASGYTRKIPVRITTSSMCDLPQSVCRELGIDLLPFKVYTDGGVFLDNVEADSDELVRYMKGSGRRLKSSPAEVEEFEEFFAKELRTSHHVIHIALTRSMSEEYKRPQEAAKSFENVTVICSEFLSSSAGLLVLCAGQMAARNEPVDTILTELERIKKTIHCSFVIAVTDYMQRGGFISEKVNMFLKAMNIRPSLRVKNDVFSVDKIFMGSKRRCYEKYIKHALPKTARPDLGVIFVTYVDLPEDEIEWIEKKIKKRFDFQHIIFQKASAAISLNCGPGTFGLLYMDWGFRSYNLGALFHEKEEIIDDLEDFNANVEPFEMTEKKVEWYDELDGIDGETAIKNSGSEESFRTVLEIFYESIKSKSAEIENYYEQEDWDNYTIKVHALKSSAKLIGALKLSEDALALENAGKEKRIDYIKAHHDDLIREYKDYLEVLSKLYSSHADGKNSDKPMADPALMETVYEEIKAAAQDFDSDTLDTVFQEMDDYTIPDEEAERFEEMRERAEMFDYDGILSLFDE